MVTSRVQEGLPFVCSPVMRMIVSSALALAQAHYPVRIIGFVVMGNHVHLILLVENPDDVAGFMERFKTETGHALNRLQGRRQRTVWCEGYDSPTILTKEDLFFKLVYVYMNPVNAGLVGSISEYPGVSSWEMFVSGRSEMKVCRIRRTGLRKLHSKTLSLRSQQLWAKQLEEESEEDLVLRVEPNAWMECFGNEEPAEEFDERLKLEIRENEKEQRKIRGGRFLGARALQLEPFFKPHVPKKFSPRMWCICSDKELRISFIEFIKVLRDRAREALERWREGDFSIPFPIGLFAPRLPRQANAIPPYLTL